MIGWDHDAIEARATRSKLRAIAFLFGLGACISAGMVGGAALLATIAGGELLHAAAAPQ